MRSVSLKPGDKIGIVSTARKISREEIEPAIQLFKSGQLVSVLGKTIGLEKNQFAGNDEQRAADLQTMIDAPEIKAIICARGGYGTVRILEKLDFSSLEKQPKWIAGYSDVTALHNLFHAKLGIPSIHSTMPINFKTNTEPAVSYTHLTLPTMLWV